MFAVICSPKYYEEINQAITSTGDQILIKAIDTDIDISSELHKVARISVKHLIIDITAIPDHKKLIQSLMQYKIRNEHTQIILVAPNYIPGNELMHQLVTQVHIYDIIAPTGESKDITILPLLKQCIECPSSYKKGVRWVMEVADMEAKEPGVTKDKPKIIEKERTVTIIKDKIVGTVIIAIVGSMHRIGTTHTTLAIANYLSQTYKVAALEFHESNHFEDIKDAYEDVQVKDKGFRLKSVDYYSYRNKESFIELLQEGYHYVILDMGLYDQCDLQEFRRSDVKIVVSGVKDWEICSLESIINTDPMISKYKYYFNFSSDKAFSFVKENMIDLDCFKAPFSPDPFESEEGGTYNELLKEFLPTRNNSQKRSFFSLFNKRVTK